MKYYTLSFSHRTDLGDNGVIIYYNVVPVSSNQLSDSTTFWTGTPPEFSDNKVYAVTVEGVPTLVKLSGNYLKTITQKELVNLTKS